MKKITPDNLEHLDEAVQRFRRAAKAVALTGAGVSVESGIDDFRSPGGLWTKFPPQEYATLEAFRRTPEKSWRLFRALGRDLLGKKPNAAHLVLAELEQRGLLHGVVTQNIDNLHQQGGSENVLEIHGNHRHLHCLRCGDLSDMPESLLATEELPRCPQCDEVVKPDVVLFGENVRAYEAIMELLYRCDILLVIGTSAEVYPAAFLPGQVKAAGGLVFEFNILPTSLTSGSGFGGSDYFFQGSAAQMLRHFRERLDS